MYSICPLCFGTSNSVSYETCNSTEQISGKLAHEQKGRVTMAAQFRGEVRAPDFPKGFDWINSDHPISIKELRGHIVILHFWTLC